MSNPRLDAALQRLERAAGRIEQAAGRPAPHEAALANLRERHERLRARVGDVVARLDALITEGDG